MDHHLPEDVRGWPQDPYQLLGVGYDVAVRDLKKAYARLIRQYRPEEFPEQFRRIRDAFEMLQQRAKFATWNAPPPPIDDPGFFPPKEPPAASPPRKQPDLEKPPEPKQAADSKELPKPEQIPDPEPFFPLNMELEWHDPDDSEGTATTFQYDLGQSPSDPAPSWSSSPDEIARLWEKACAGEEALSYRRMREIYQQNPRDKDIPLRLYWLLSLSPDLDPHRHPCDWLAEILRGSGLSNPCKELYRRYIVNNPQEAMSERYVRLLESPASPLYLAQFIEWRWQAAGRLRLAKVIMRDLDQFRSRLLGEDEASWARLLFLAADELAWYLDDRAANAFDECRHELEELEHLQAQFGELFSRLDFLQDLSQAWRRAMTEDSSNRTERWRRAEEWTAVMNLVPLSWTRPLPELRTLFVQYFESSWDHPQKTLAALDDVQRSAPVLLSQLIRVLESLQFSVPIRPQDSAAIIEIDLRTRRFLEGVDANNYQEFRARLLTYCFREFLAPERMAEVVESRSHDQNLVNLFGEVRNDWPLRCLCLAHRLFWA